MLLYFKVTNSRSFAKEAVFSMIATEDYPDEFAHHIDSQKIKILKTAIIYGANASGKSNLIKAMSDAKNIIVNSFRFSKDFESKLFYNPNKNIIENHSKPTHYTFGLYLENRVFEYSFSNNQERIIHESLIEKMDTENDLVHFIRIFDNKNDKYNYPVKSTEFNEKFQTVIPFTKKTNLFLTICSQLSEDEQYKIRTADLIFQYFDTKLGVSIYSQPPGIIDINYALNLIREDESFKSFILKFLKKADFSIVDIKFNENGFEESKCFTIHQALNDKNETVLLEYDLFKEESTGTLQYIAWLYYWFFAINLNETIIIDEFGNSLHPLLSQYLLNLFQESKSGQLIFTTHDVKLMNSRFIYPEQIWLVKRDQLFNSSIFSLSDFDIDKNKMVLDNNYLDGLFNGIPNITI